MIQCTRRIEFDAAHRVIGHEFKCKYLHGHRYVLEVTAVSEQLDNLGRVVDFGELKNIVKDWIDANWDHNIILNLQDKKLGDYISESTGQKVYYIDVNPTAENMVLHLKSEVFPKLFKNANFSINKVKLFETPNAFVEL